MPLPSKASSSRTMVFATRWSANTAVRPTIQTSVGLVERNSSPSGLSVRRSSTFRSRERTKYSPYCSTQAAGFSSCTVTVSFVGKPRDTSADAI